MALSVCECFGKVNSTRRKLVFTRGYGGNEGVTGFRPFNFGIRYLFSRAVLEQRRVT